MRQRSTSSHVESPDGYFPDGLSLPPLLQMEASVCRDSMASFSEGAWPIIEPKPLIWNWHIDLLCDYMEEVEAGNIKRLIINLPGGTSKSTFASVIFPCWTWTRNASKRFLTFSFSDVNTIRDNRRARQILTSEWYKQRFPAVRFIDDQNQKIKFETTATGWRIASSVDGMGVGEHPDFIIIDDPLKPTSIYHPSRLVNCNNWFSGTVSTRLARNPAIILIMQRLHEDDLSGWLQRKGGWTVLSLPMRYNPKHKNLSLFDIRTKPGELLWPERLDEATVREEETNLGPFQASAQLGQEPKKGTGKVKVSWLQFVDDLPADVTRRRGWDTGETDEEEAAAEAKEADYCAGVKVALGTNGRIYIEDVIEERTTDHDELIIGTARRDGRDCGIVEGSGNGKSNIKARSAKLHGYTYDVFPETESKLQRAQSFISQCRRRNVYLKRAPWNDHFISHITSFPFGAHDDIMDATVFAYLELSFLGVGTTDRRLTFGKGAPNNQEARIAEQRAMIPTLSPADRRKLMRGGA